MKKLILPISVIIIILITVSLLYPIEILRDLKLYRKMEGGYNLLYKSEKIGYIGGLDSWYVENNQVYGTISDEHKDDLNYFYVNVCTHEKFVTSDFLNFENFLDRKGINKDRRSYMSGNNIVNMQKFKYSQYLDCG